MPLYLADIFFDLYLNEFNYNLKPEDFILLYDFLKIL